MKRIISVILVLVLIFSLVSCNIENKNAYVLSDDVKDGSVINGVMTDISSSNSVLTKTSAKWIDKAILYEVNIRQYTKEGTFSAFEEHLDELKSMGINCLWLMPIHPISKLNRKGTLGSYYSVSDYLDVNPEFGTLDDFNHLLNSAHKKGFKVILDWVANHTGWDNKWIDEHKDWYKYNNGKIVSPYDWTDAAQLNYDNYEMRAEMIDCMRYWVEDIGVDGFRCDHAVGVPAPFWNAAVYKLKSINSELMFLAEASASQALTNYAFDCTYNDKLYNQLLISRDNIIKSDIENALTVDNNFKELSFPMNYLDNHDKNSYDESIETRFGGAYVPFLALEYLAPGMPMMYSGNEIMSEQVLSFFDKDEIIWDDWNIRDYIKEYSNIKEKFSCLNSTNHNIEFINTSSDKVLAFSRQNENDEIVFVCNLDCNKVSNVTVNLENSYESVFHYDGFSFDTLPTVYDTENYSGINFQAYEFYILTKKHT